LSSDKINIGNADTAVTINATNIKQIIKTLDGSLIENTVGNTNVNSSMSISFNRKNISPVGGATGCFTITSNSADQLTSQYFEIYVSGSNNGRGGYTYKGCFGVEKISTGLMTASSVNTLFYFGTGSSPPTSTAIPVITFTSTSTVLTVLVNTSNGGSTDQNYIATLTSYPTATRRTAIPRLEDFIIVSI